MHAKVNESSTIGFAAVDISPDRPMPLAGYGSRNGCFDTLDAPLEANTIVAAFDQGTVKDTVVIASLDTLFVDEELRDELAALVDLEPQNRLLVASHTHNAPGLVPYLQPLGAAGLRYRKFVLKAVSDAILSCLSRGDLRPSSASHAHRHGDYAVNRRLRALSLDYCALRRGKLPAFGRR